jgi:hypothetical protein
LSSPRPANFTKRRIQEYGRQLTDAALSWPARRHLSRKAGRRAAGLKLLTEAKQVAEKNHETWCNAKLELEHAELVLLEASEEAGREADAAFKHAIDIAASQGAKTLELRARVARARHCAQQGKGQTALDILSPIYDWFSQGFGTLDLLQAKTLLDELR